jgi:hypothetical protein
MYKAYFDSEYVLKGYSFADPRFSTNTAFIFYKLEKIPSPSQFAMIADSFSVNSVSGVDSMKPNWQLSPTYSGMGFYAHLLHSGFANCGFSDGRAAGLNSRQLRQTSTAIHYSSDRKYNIVYIP